LAIGDKVGRIYIQLDHMNLAENQPECYSDR